jgi:glycosyltransferase involved in cell wall biosynthesis
VAENDWRREISELIRERMINDLAPDVLLIMSLFEGAVDDSVTSIRRLPTSTTTAVILYDLIPFLDPEKYIPAPPSSTWYYSKIDSLKKADLLLAISESARMEATDALGFDGERVVTIYSAADESFSKDKVLPAKMEEVLTRAGITRNFILHASAFEPRKNFEGLIRAFGLLPKNIRKSYQLVLVTAIDLAGQISLRNLANDAGLDEDDLAFA